MADLLESGIKLLILVCSIGVGAACIVAWCQVAKRLGYDLYAGLLMVIPVVNVIIFFCWAFRESPNERKLRQMQQQMRGKS